MSNDKDTRPASFPQDIAACHALLESVFHSLEERNKRIDQLEAIVDKLIRERYGPKSERNCDFRTPVTALGPLDLWRMQRSG